MAVVLLGLALLAFVSWIFGIMMAVAQDLPSLENRAQYAHAQNSVVYDAYGNRLATLTNNQGRVLNTTEEIAPVMKEAVVAIEDQRFYDHRGVDFQGIARAVWTDITSASTQQGASTITQQFVKNALATQENRTVFEKLREAALAYHLERQWSKDKILTEYLNEIYFGEGATGIEAAAKTFFGWNHPGCGPGSVASEACAAQLEPQEAALLAGIISSPSAYSPRSFPENATARRNQVLQNMVDQGYITQDEYNLYAAEPIPTAKQIQPPAENSQAPYFTSWLRQQLVDRYGAGEAFGGGLQIKSSLDLELQNRVQEIAGSTLSGIAPTASIVVLNNDDASVRAMVGGPDYQEAPFNLATNGHRQPGSAFKPFTLVTALEQGRSTSETFASAPQEIPYRTKVPEKNGDSKIVPEIFAVDNYNDSYLGTASILSGTTYSDNSVYSQLGTQVGVQNVAATAQRMGIETDLSTPGIEYSINDGPWQPYNPALILGGLQTGVTPLEMAHGYNTLQEDGRRISGSMAADSGGPVGILDVYDGGECSEDGGSNCYQQGEPVPDQTGASGVNKVVSKQVIEPTVAQTAKSVLSTVVSSGTGERAATGEPTWGKTGTTDNNGDAWFCGATPKITACVWVGHADSVTPMETEYAGAPVDGGTFPALIFAQVVNAYEDLEAARNAGDDTDTDSTTVPTEPTVPTTEAPAAPAPTESAPEPTEPATPSAPADGGAAPASGDGAVAPG